MTNNPADYIKEHFNVELTEAQKSMIKHIENNGRYTVIETRPRRYGLTTEQLNMFNQISKKDESIELLEAAE